ncbi:hypothetical protein H7U20_26240 [Rugamonas sp. CCM 8940]|nr:hypothetical protein [Rugamonas sp. CCM 8940]
MAIRSTAWIDREFGRLALADARLNRRARTLLKSMTAEKRASPNKKAALRRPLAGLRLKDSSKNPSFSRKREPIRRILSSAAWVPACAAVRRCGTTNSSLFDAPLS